MAGPRSPDASIDIPADELTVIDGYSQAIGQKRTTLIRQILREWSAHEHRKAVFITRVAGDKLETPGSIHESPGAGGGLDE